MNDTLFSIVMLCTTSTCQLPPWMDWAQTEVFANQDACQATAEHIEVKLSGVKATCVRAVRIYPRDRFPQ